jgi:hypothetical protein
MRANHEWLGPAKRMHPRLKTLADRFAHAERACRANAEQCAEHFGAEHPYRICYTRVGNKAHYAFEQVECYAHRIDSKKPELAEEEAERLIEIEKWYLISVLSVVEYSMSDFLAGRGSAKLRDAARDGPFSAFTKQAVLEGAIGDEDCDYLRFLMRVRNDIIHRNGVSLQNDALSYEGRVFELRQGQMIEGHLGMLTDLGSLAAHLISSVTHHMEANLKISL